MMFETPSGVVFVTLYESSLTVKMFSCESKAIMFGAAPTLAQLGVETPPGVIFDNQKKPEDSFVGSRVGAKLAM